MKSASKNMNAAKLNALLDVTKAINNNVSTPQLLILFEDILRNLLNITKMVLYSNNNGWNCLLHYGSDVEFVNINVERDLLRYKEINVMDVQLTDSNHTFDVIIPVYHKNRPLAYVLIGDVDDQKVEMSPLIKHLPFVQTLTNIIVVAIENKRLYKESLQQAAMRKELELASEMQQMLFPESLPNNEYIQFDSYYLPHQEVGGDYYDLIWLNKNELAFCMADVSGKGIPAALLMSNFQANLRVLINHTASLTELVNGLNQRVMSNAKGEKFITFFIAKYNTQTRMLTYINAGHNPPILLNGNSSMFLKIGTTGLGMFDELPAVKEGIVPILPDSKILLYTDGAVEVENEEEEHFGAERLLQLFEMFKSADIHNINKMIINEITDYKGNKSYTDDIALFAGYFK